MTKQRRFLSPKADRRRRAPPGAAPGTLMRDPAAAAPVVRAILYGPDQIEELAVTEVEALRPLIGRRPVMWVNVDGLGDVELIRRLGDLFGLHRLALEDVVNTHQRPKVEEYADHIFIVTKIVHEEPALATEQVAMFLGRDFLLTFQERDGDCFDPVRERLRNDRGRIRGSQADYLAYALLDAAIDEYFPVLERYGELVEGLEDAVMAAPTARVVSRIHLAKRDLLTLRRAIWPQREAINALVRDVSPLIAEPTRIHLRDCYDHCVQLMDMVETYREIASGLVDIHLSSVSAHMNEIMKVLTIIATIFMPLGFIAGVYGMNFNAEVSPWNMPELRWYWGYPFVLGLMAVVAAGLLVYFRRKGWIGGDRLPEDDGPA